jgi:Na+-transporting NADH:ubiquinone oxidoreductase subunit B
VQDGSPLEQGYSGPTPLAIAASSTGNAENDLYAFGTGWADGIYSFSNFFIGVMPGSIGETSTLMCLIGGAILIYTGVGSWKIIVSVFAGAMGMGLLINAIGANPFSQLPAQYHLVMGGLAFGAVFMATDPVTAAHTEVGKWIYGVLIGMFTVLIRIFNPAYPEGIMLAILFMNVMAPLIDYYVISANKKRRMQRATVQ